MGDAFYNPFEPGFAEHPYDQYGRIRDESRTQRTVFGTLLVHRYDDCFAVLRQPGTSVRVENAEISNRIQIPDELLTGTRRERGRHAILNIDPPDHTRIRRLVSSAFTVRRIEQLRPRVRLLVDRFLDDVERAGAGGEPVDLMAGFAFPSPSR